MTSGGCDKASLINRVVARLRETERTARTRLEEGCADDIKRLAGFIEGPLAAARLQAGEATMGMGKPNDVDLARSLFIEAFERIGLRCIELVCASANVRFRARSKLYAEELLKVETLLVDSLGADDFIRAKHVLPRMFGVGHLSLDNVLVPEGPKENSDAEIAAWIERLGRCIQRTLLIEIDTAQHAVLKSGARRLAGVCVRLSLATRKGAR